MAGGLTGYKTSLYVISAVKSSMRKTYKNSKNLQG